MSDLLAPLRARRRSPRRQRPYETDPPSAASTRLPTLPGTVFDVPRLMAGIRAGLIEGIPPLDHPTDELLIATVVAHGMPRWSAEQMKYNPMLRLHYYMFWLDVREAAKGIKESQDRVDGAKATWAHMRKEELISDIPNHTVGFWER